MIRARIGIVLLTWPLLAAAPGMAGWDEGVAAFKAKNFAQAAREFEGVVRDRSDWAGGYLMLGRSQLLLERTSDAVTSLRKAYDMDPQNVEIQLALAQAYLGARRAAEASQLLSKVSVAGLPKERQALFQQLQAKAASESGQEGLAASSLAKAATASPNDASIQYNYGISLLNSGNTSASVAALEKAARLDPADPDKQKVLTQALIRLGRETQGNAKDAVYERAADSARLLVNKSASYDNLLLLGETQLGAGQYDAAVASFAQASTKNGGDWLPHFYSGQAQTATAKYSDAEASLRRALDRASASADKARCWKQLGFVYEKRKDFAQAKNAYRSGGDERAVTRIQENEEIAKHNAQADVEAQRLAELKQQQEELRKQIQAGGAPPPLLP